MNAADLYLELERNFITSAMTDDWSEMPDSQFVTKNFKKRAMGLVCDNATTINKVYTAVFPSNLVMQSIIDKDETDIMLFVHHPMVWDIRKDEVFAPMDSDLLAQFRKQRISIYNLHVPLDNYGDYSTSRNLAWSIGIETSKPFYAYHGALAAVFGVTELPRASDLLARFANAIGHRASFYPYGSNVIKGGLVGVCAGGGNAIPVLEEIVGAGGNTLITGITVRNAHSEKAHDYAMKNGINILGGTHYSTEKFACQAMCNYFVKLGIPSGFVVDIPVFEDL